MPKAKKTQEMQEVEHAYANLDHQEWSEDIQKWKLEFRRFKEILARAEKWVDHHGTQLGHLEDSLKRHEVAVQEHKDGTTTGGNVRYIKDVADQRHELYGKTHGDHKIVHEDLKRRHYILIGQLDMLSRALETDNF